MGYLPIHFDFDGDTAIFIVAYLLLTFIIFSQLINSADSEMTRMLINNLTNKDANLCVWLG